MSMTAMIQQIRKFNKDRLYSTKKNQVEILILELKSVVTEEEHLRETSEAEQTIADFKRDQYKLANLKTKRNRDG